MGAAIVDVGRMTGRLTQLSITVCVCVSRYWGWTHIPVVCAQSKFLCHGKRWPAGERRGHCSQAATKAEVYIHFHQGQVLWLATAFAKPGP